MTLGVIARGDRGGLANMTVELVRHLRPTNVLLVDLGPMGRGPTVRERVEPFCEKLWVAEHIEGQRYGWPTEAEMFFAESSTVYTAETLYDQRTFDFCRSYGIRLVLHAMPELLGSTDAHRASEVWLPTSWLDYAVRGLCAAAAKPEPRLMPVPIASHHYALRARRRTKAEVFYADGGEAFHDRNGLQAVYTACEHMQSPCKLIVRGGPHPPEAEWTVGKVDIEWRDSTESYTDAIPDEADVIVMPRRYAGLSLPIQEAAALGMPALMTDLAPQNTDGWLSDAFPACPVLSSYDVSMKGGMIPVHQPDAIALAAIMDHLIENPDLVGLASDHATRWAESLSWERWQPIYAEALDG